MSRICLALVAVALMDVSSVVGETVAPDFSTLRNPVWISKSNLRDPYIWFSKQYGNRYYGVTRDVLGIFAGEAGGITLFESSDGLNWKPAAHPKVLGNQFKWEDGTMIDSKIERPVPLFDGEEPIALFWWHGWSSGQRPHFFQRPDYTL